MMIEKLVSGGQTGADIAALDVALRYNFPHGGWCPKGRLSLDGQIPAKYLLTATPSSGYPQRTEWNVRDSDGTVVFTFSKAPTGGSLKTVGFTKKHRKPCLHISRASGTSEDPPLILQRFIGEHGIKTLNVAGSRESKDPGIYEWVKQVLADAFFWGEDHPGVLGGPGEG
jgi:hypothetical protein